MRKWLFVIGFCFIAVISYGQSYQAPADAEVAKKLAQWSDQKFGLFMHWGIYSIPGIVESWSINSEDASWIPRDSTKNYEDYKRWYFSIQPFGQLQQKKQG